MAKARGKHGQGRQRSDGIGGVEPIARLVDHGKGGTVHTRFTPGVDVEDHRVYHGHDRRRSDRRSGQETQDAEMLMHDEGAHSQERGRDDCVGCLHAGGRGCKRCDPVYPA